MRVLTVSLRALALCSLLLLIAFPVFAFDEDHHAVINGAMLHFRVRGTDKANPTLVLLHGGPGLSSHMFYGWGRSLEKSVNVVYLDQRGCGESARLSFADPVHPKPSEIKDYTFAALTSDLEGVRRFLKVDKWFVLGHSYGGMLGLEYVTAHPDHVLGYIQMDGLVSVPQMENDILREAAAKFTAAPKDNANLQMVAQIRALPADNPDRLFGLFGLAMGPAALYFAGDQRTEFSAFNTQMATAIKPYSVPFTALMPASEPGAALDANEHFLTRDDTPLLSKIAVPMLILSGKQDGIITLQSAEAVHAAVPGSQIVEIDHSGHFPFFEQPEKTTAAVLAFTNFKNGSRVNQEAEPIGDYAGLEFPQQFDSTTNASSAVVHYTVSETGHAEQVYIVQSCGNQIIDQACVKSILKTRYRAALKDGVAVSAPMERTFTIAR